MNRGLEGIPEGGHVLTSLSNFLESSLGNLTRGIFSLVGKLKLGVGLEDSTRLLEGSTFPIQEGLPEIQQSHLTIRSH